MNWKTLIDNHWNDLFGLLLLLLAVPAYIAVNGEFGALVAGAGLMVIKGDRKQRKTDVGESR
jgi:hypothetical protein